MPDTGAPWNIPYVEAADLVSDWPADSLALANAIADGLDDASNAGIGSNVVSTTKTDVFTTTSSSLTAVTGLSATISPTTTANKVLVIAKVQMNMSNNEVGGASLFRGATELDSGTPVSNRLGRSGSMFTNNTLGTGELTLIYLDSPATTSATTYAVHVSVTAGTLRVNATSNDTDISANYRTSSTITVIEVSA